MTGQLSGRLFAFRLPSVMSLLGLSFLSAFSFSSFYPSSSSLLLASAQLKILAPKSLVKQYYENHALYGQKYLYVSNTSFGDRSLFKQDWSILLSALYVKDKNAHCMQDYCDIINSTIKETDGAKTVVVVDRGQCSFAHKADIAQDNCGAAAVIVVDNKPGSNDDVDRANILNMRVTGEERTDKTLRVPTVLLSAADGKRLKASIAQAKKNGRPVLFELFPEILSSDCVEGSRTPRTDCTE
eukprot:GHVS01068508.1.p1 GENE.GHVS01068508.1~~GHVS01068508.1.p1  ORF type:complete len:241 (+),score=26.06 GHVS01068508.1:178-900(+)